MYFLFILEKNAACNFISLAQFFVANPLMYRRFQLQIVCNFNENVQYNTFSY